MEEIIAHIVQPFNWFDAVIAICTIVLSILAIVISIITFRSQKEHNKNSVRPILNIIFGDYADEMSILLVNNGVGPAIIKSFNCRCSAEKEKSKKNLIDLIKFWISEQSDIEYVSEKLNSFPDIVEDITGRSVAPGHGIALLRLSEPDIDQNGILRRFLNEVNIEVIYTDIYNSNPWICNRSGKLFEQDFHTRVVANNQK